MLARRKMKRRIDDALAVASPVAFADAIDAYMTSRSPQDARALAARSFERMDSGERSQLEFYLNLDDPDDLIGHRFSAFLRQNPRAMTALDAGAVEAILQDVGELPPFERARRRLPAPTAALVALIVAVTVLPLAAQYARQRGLLADLSDPVLPAAIVPFVQHFTLHKTPPPAIRRQPPRAVYHPVQRRAIARRHRSIPRHYAVVRRPAPKKTLAWKFDRLNNPYFNRVRWRHPFVERYAWAPRPRFVDQARLSVRSYLRALALGDTHSALAHLGLPPTADTKALAEMPIVSRASTVAIVGSKTQADGNEQVQAEINTDGREYYEVFAVARDGPALRIVDHYYIPVNRSAQVAAAGRPLKKTNPR